jgi:hypothetical protein
MEYDSILSEIYYKPGGFQPPNKLYQLAIKKNSNITMRDVRAWLEAQSLRQYNKQINMKRFAQHGHFLITKPNYAHMADLLHMPEDKGYKFILCVIDIASRYKAAYPLKERKSADLVKGFKHIYSNTLLTMPDKLLCDPGSEFKGEVAKFFHGKIIYSEAGHHKSQALVERFNRTLSERLFKYLYMKEIETDEIYNKWVDILQPTVDALNDETTRMIGMKPNEAITMDKVELHIKQELDAPELSIGDIVRYKLARDEIHDISDSRFKNKEVVNPVTKFERRRATDVIYSLTKHKIESKSIKMGLPILYYISGKKHGYTSANLMKIA